MAEVAKSNFFDMVKDHGEGKKHRQKGCIRSSATTWMNPIFAELRNFYPFIRRSSKDGKGYQDCLYTIAWNRSYPVKRVPSDLGFENVYIEPQQASCGWPVPTAPYPNPENPDAWELALKLAKEKDADLVLATIRCRSS